MMRSSVPIEAPVVVASVVIVAVVAAGADAQKLPEGGAWELTITA